MTLQQNIPPSAFEQETHFYIVDQTWSFIVFRACFLFYDVFI